MDFKSYQNNRMKHNELRTRHAGHDTLAVSVPRKKVSKKLTAKLKYNKILLCTEFEPFPLERPGLPLYY